MITTNLREHDGRIILAHGEVTGHAHQVLTATTLEVPTVAQAQFFELDGVRELVVLEPCVLVHQEHGRIALDPQVPQQVRQGDVLLCPTGPGTWRVDSTPEPDGTRKRYALLVPPEHQTAHAAVASTFGLTEREYAPAYES